MEQTARQRNRASTACTQCRKSRIRCVVNPGKRECSQCTSNDTKCIFDDKDGRKSRASSKAFADGLCRRIEQLESMLQQQSSKLSMGQSTSQGQSNNNTQQNSEELPIENPVPDTSIQQSQEDPPPYHDVATNFQAINAEDVQREPEVPWTEPAHNKSLVRQLVPSAVRFDMASGRVRFFGPSAIMNVLSETNTSKSLERQESHWPIALLISDLSPETHDYLIDLFWSCHNSVFHIVHKDAFYNDRERGGTQFYSVFLHFAMLAMSIRYADKDRLDIQLLMPPGGNISSLHEKARSLAALELERPGGIPSIQALFLLGDIECMTGRDDRGWCYAGMSLRLIFDVGLHQDPSALGLTEREVQIRHMVLWACILNDKYWSMYLGRPTALKIQDISPTCLEKDFGRLISCRPSGHEKSMETRVYENLLQLIELVGPLYDLGVQTPAKVSDAYYKIAAVDRELSNWYNELPEDIQLTPSNAATCVPSLLLLHSQYHTALILLHRPFLKYSETHADAQSKEADNERVSHFTMLSRTVCGDNAKRVASILKRYRERFDMTQVFVTALQHAGTAATALIAEIVIQSNYLERKEMLAHLSCLKLTLSLMSRTYQPAVLMSSVVDHFIKDHQRGKEGAPSSEGSSSNSASSGTDYDQQQQMGLSSGVGYGKKRSYNFENFGEGFGNITMKRARFEQAHCFTPRGKQGQSPKGLPFLPSSWLEEFDFEDTEFLNLMGMKDLQNNPAAIGGLLSSSSFPGDTDFGLM